MPILQRTNELPPVLLGLSEDELLLVIISSAVVSLLLSCLVCALLWHWWACIAVAPIPAVLGTRYGGSLLCRIKLGKPANFYPLLIAQRFDRLLGTGATSSSGPWSVIRRNRFEGGQ